MRRALAALFALLAACGDPDGVTVTHVIRDSGYDPSIFAAGGVALEIHNAPFEGMEPRQIAALVSLPASMPRGLRLPLVAPGAAENHRAFRLVLVFNGTNGPASLTRACTATQPLPAAPSSGEGYSVHAVVCRQGKPLLSGYMRAAGVRAGDDAAISRSLGALFRAMGLARQEHDR